MEGPDKSAGRPPLDDAVFADIVARLEAGESPKEIHDALSVSTTKIYEIRRYLSALKSRDGAA